MNTLYIIGNGFDLFHKLKTKYQHFALFLQKNNSELYELMVKYYWLTDLDPEDEENSLRDELWGDFENKLAEMDFEALLDDFRDYLPDYSSDEFRSRDYHTFDQEIGRMIDRLTKELYAEFKEFILDVEFEHLPSNLINLERDSVFLNFNYTDTLEHYYGVERKKITYIHGRAKTDAEQTILGHGINPEEFRDKPTEPPAGLNEEEYYEWRQEMSDNHDYAYDTGRDTAIGYFKTSHKSTGEIKVKNKQFFTSIATVRKVIILGHSISKIDQPYFLEVIRSVHPDTKWTVSYFGDTEKEERTRTLVNLGISESNIDLIKIEDLRTKQPDLFNEV